MSKEAKFRTRITEYAEGKGWHVSNIESHMSSPGIPDMNIFARGRGDFWFELKVASLQGVVKMRPTQKAWHRARHECGGSSWVVVMTNDGRTVYVIPGHVAASKPPGTHVHEGAVVTTDGTNLEWLSLIVENYNG